MYAGTVNREVNLGHPSIVRAALRTLVINAFINSTTVAHMRTKTKVFVKRWQFNDLHDLGAVHKLCS